LQVVDYTAHQSLPDYLSSMVKAPGQKPFDAIIDCVGTDALYNHSPEYLKPDGKYLYIEFSPWGFLKLNSYWLPSMLGLTPRTCINAFSKPSGDSAKRVATWVEKGWISEVPIDSIFEMDNAIEVDTLETKTRYCC
jgi:NADPH:quinone reductase-like Zn-dependent oxidoreductase